MYVTLSPSSSVATSTPVNFNYTWIPSQPRANHQSLSTCMHDLRQNPRPCIDDGVQLAYRMLRREEKREHVRDALVLCEPAKRVKKVMEHLLYDMRLDSLPMERYVSDS
jgi:hypothetical protein